jgi:hypothetical protein
MSMLLASAAIGIVPPARVGAWLRPESPRVVVPADIFAYMDGAGELYLAYGLVRLEAWEYTAETSPSEGSDRHPGDEEDPILLELYQLASSDDGYGLLSNDWGGEAVALEATGPSLPPRALYGAGLLRAWSGDLYLRVLATTETDASRAAVLELARAVMAGRPGHEPPGLVTALPEVVAGTFRLRTQSVNFLRSHLVLNSIYFLATANLLGLSPATEAVAASYARAEGGRAARLRLLVVRYPTADAAREALDRFRQGYLHESGAPAAATVPAVVRHAAGTAQVEDGWLGYRLVGQRLVLVFEAPDERSAGAVLDEFRQ